jgi:hypothetical protein
MQKLSLRRHHPERIAHAEQQDTKDQLPRLGHLSQTEQVQQGGGGRAEAEQGAAAVAIDQRAQWQ